MSSGSMASSSAASSSSSAASSSPAPPSSAAAAPAATMPDFSALLEDAYASARRQASAKGKEKAAQAAADTFAAQEEVISFGDLDASDDEQGDGDDERPNGGKTRKSKPGDIAKLTRPLSVTQLAGSTKSKSLDDKLPQAGDKGVTYGKAPTRQMSATQRREERAKTSGAKWFDMPAQKMTNEVKRELQAMRLRNAIDPKKFMRGAAKESVGEFFQFGHIIEGSNRATTQAPRVLPKRSFVDELVADEHTGDYTKRKYSSDVMTPGMRGRKGKRMTEREVKSKKRKRQQ